MTIIRKLVIFQIILFLLLGEASLYAENLKVTKSTIPATKSIAFLNITKKNNNLLDGQINDIVQDKQGVMWIATWEGLNRYDGHRFISVFDVLPNEEKLENTNVIDLALGNDGTLWILTSSSISTYNYQKNIFREILKVGDEIRDEIISNFRKIEINKNGEMWILTDKQLLKGAEGLFDFIVYSKAKGNLPSEEPLRIFINDSDLVLLSTYQEGLWIYNREKNQFEQFIKNLKKLDRNAKNIRAITQARTNKFWVTTNNGLLHLSENGEILKWINPDNSSWLKQTKLLDIELDDFENIIVTSRDSGVYYLDKKGNLIVHLIKKEGQSSSLLSDRTSIIFKDRMGFIWIGTENDGISIWNSQNSFIKKISNQSIKTKSLSSNIIWSVFQDRKMGLWIGTDDGLNFWDAEENKFIYFNIGKMASGADAEVSVIVETPANQLWLATGLGLMQLNPISREVTSYNTQEKSEDGLNTDVIYSLFMDSVGRLWIGHNQGISYRDEKTKKFIHLNENREVSQELNSNEVSMIREDPSGNVWMGTNTGVCKYRRENDLLKCWHNTPQGFTTSFLFEKNWIWEGLSGNGLLKLDMNNPEKNFLEFKAGKGFPTNSVSGVLRDSKGRLWLSSQNGLVVFNPENNQYTVIEASDGLGDSEFNDSAYLRLNDGRFAFGSINGVVIVEPEKFEFSNKISQVYITRIDSISDQKRIIDTENISLPEENSGLKINFSNLNYFSPEQSLYQYKSGKNKDWIDLGNKSEILFAESRSGDHNIHIRSKYLGGEWGPEEVVSFYVYPPLWRNNYFLTLYVLLAGLAIMLFLRYRQQQLEEKYVILDTLKESEQQLRLSLDASEQGVWDWKTKNDGMSRSKTQELLHMDAPATLVEYWSLIQDYDRLSVIKSWNAHLFGKQQNYHCQYRIQLGDEEIWIEEQGRAIERDKYGMAVHISGTYRNITHTKIIEKNLSLLAKAFEDTAEGMLIVDKNLEVVQVNNAITEITGYHSKELIGQSISTRTGQNAPISFLDEVWQGVAEEGLWQGEVWQKNSDDEEIPLWLNVSEIKNDDQETYYVLIISDISDRKATEEELRYLANYDTLTKLPNRALLRDRLDHALGNAKRQHRPLAILFLDLDRFKNVNDSFGHAVGDGLLVVVAERLKECLREDDTVSRLGGDEFVILMEHFSSINAIAGVTEKIRMAMTEPLRLEGVDIQSSFSIGVSVFPSDGEDSATLLRNADTAMYHAKEAGRNRVQFYAPKMNESALERLTLENDLRTAIGSGQLEVYFQPQVRSGDGSLYGAEALVRWNHPERGFLTPFHFIPMAEESDLIVSLGNEVLYKACVQMQKWQKKYGLDIRISINLAARQMLQLDLARHIENVVKRTGLSPSMVTLEITETAVMEDLKRAKKILDSLRSKGFKIAIDDFGTGYSSLNYLRNIPLDIIKIDYSFVRELLNNTVDQAIVSAIIEIGGALDLEVLAEGIETVEQETMLLDKGCELYQGYLFGKPMTAVDFTNLIETTIAKQEKQKKQAKLKTS